MILPKCRRSHSRIPPQDPHVMFFKKWTRHDWECPSKECDSRSIMLMMLSVLRLPYTYGWPLPSTLAGKANRYHDFLHSTPSHACKVHSWLLIDRIRSNAKATSGLPAYTSRAAYHRGLATSKKDHLGRMMVQIGIVACAMWGDHCKAREASCHVHGCACVLVWDHTTICTSRSFWWREPQPPRPTSRSTLPTVRSQFSCVPTLDNERGSITLEMLCQIVNRYWHLRTTVAL